MSLFISPSTSLNISDLTITGTTNTGESISFNISPNTTTESLNLSLIGDNNQSLEYSFSDDGSLHLSELANVSISSSSGITDTDNSLDFGNISGIHQNTNDEHELNDSDIELPYGGKKSRKLKKRNKNKKKRKTKKNKTKCIY